MQPFSMFSSFSPRETKTYIKRLIAAGLQDRFLFQENDQVMKMCRLDLWLGSIYSGWTECCRLFWLQLSN